MGGRNAKPIPLNRKHLTKSEKEHREKSQVKIGKDRITCPAYVKSDKKAFSKWKELISEYNAAKDNGIDLLKSSDTGLLARYCVTYSEYLKLLDNRKNVEQFDVKWDEFEKDLPGSIVQGINTLLRLDPLMKIENAINKKMDMLIKMEDRLFLHPLAKIKNIPKQEEKKADKFGAMFD